MEAHSSASILPTRRQDNNLTTKDLCAMTDLGDTTFLLLAKFDSLARLENALAVTEFIRQNSSIFPRLMPKGVEWNKYL